MKKLISKHQFGGIADWVDNKLNSLGSIGKLGVSILDPTGITSWKDVKDSYKTFKQDTSLANAGLLGLAAFSAVPMVGKVVKVADAAHDTKLVSKALFDPDTYKLLLDPEYPPAMWMRRNFSQEMKKRAEKILDNQIENIVNWCKFKGITKLPRGLEDKVVKFIEKKNIFTDNQRNPRQLIDIINTELKGY